MRLAGWRGLATALLLAVPLLAALPAHAAAGGPDAAAMAPAEEPMDDTPARRTPAPAAEHQANGGSDAGGAVFNPLSRPSVAEAKPEAAPDSDSDSGSGIGSTIAALLVGLAVLAYLLRRMS